MIFYYFFQTISQKYVIKYSKESIIKSENESDGRFRAMRKKFLDFVASLCLCFNVDWDKDFEDDEYCLEKKERAIKLNYKDPMAERSAEKAG